MTPETYCRAETDRTFYNAAQLAGGVNRFFHFRTVTPLGNQTVVRMNRDTLYSPAQGCHTATYWAPENNAFWSTTVYGADGYMKSDNALLNQSNAMMNPDGTFTVHFGSQADCGDVPNRLDVTEGWNFLMRVYRPGKSVLDGSYKLPEVTPAKGPVNALTTAEARAIAKEATIYGFPLVDNMRIQEQYSVKPLSAFLGQPAPQAAPAIDFPQPLTPVTQRTSLEFFTLLNFYLQFCPTHPSEQALMDRFAKIGVGAGQTFDPDKLSPEIKQAIEGGVADAWAEFQDLVGRVNRGEVSSGDVFGTREFLQNNYLFRMGAAVIGIYGNTKEEAIYPVYFVDGDRQPLDGSHRYTLRFAKGQLPPVNSFWSLTKYDQPASPLVHNPIDRYLLNSTMLPDFKYDADGGLTLHIQNASPGKDKEANCLPAPQGPFSMVLRLYWPQAAALDGTWTAPPVQKSK